MTRVPRRATVKLAVIVADPRWRKDTSALSLMRRAARIGLTASSPRNAPAETTDALLTILLADDSELQAMNRQFRKKDKPTNVLSFPSPDHSYLGDIALSYQTVASEARAQKKPFAHHAAHMALHGVLHLLGYDHQRKREADAMEKLETALLAKLGIAPPYDLRPLPRGVKRA